MIKNKSPHPRRLGNTEFVDQKEFSTLIDIIGSMYLDINNEGEIGSKIFLYKNHAYIYIYKGELDISPTLERDIRLETSNVHSRLFAQWFERRTNDELLQQSTIRAATAFRNSRTC